MGESSVVFCFFYFFLPLCSLKYKGIEGRTLKWRSSSFNHFCGMSEKSRYRWSSKTAAASTPMVVVFVVLRVLLLHIFTIDKVAGESFVNLVETSIRCVNSGLPPSHPIPDTHTQYDVIAKKGAYPGLTSVLLRNFFVSEIHSYTADFRHLTAMDDFRLNCAIPAPYISVTILLPQVKRVIIAPTSLDNLRSFTLLTSDDTSTDITISSIRTYFASLSYLQFGTMNVTASSNSNVSVSSCTATAMFVVIGGRLTVNNSVIGYVNMTVRAVVSRQSSLLGTITITPSPKFVLLLSNLSTLFTVEEDGALRIPSYLSEESAIFMEIKESLTPPIFTVTPPMQFIVSEIRILLQLNWRTESVIVQQSSDADAFLLGGFESSSVDSGEKFVDETQFLSYLRIQAAVDIAYKGLIAVLQDVDTSYTTELNMIGAMFERIAIYDNPSSLPVSKIAQTAFVEARFHLRHLTSIVLSKCPSLRSLVIIGNSELTTVDITGTSIEMFYVDGTGRNAATAARNDNETKHILSNTLLASYILASPKIEKIVLKKAAALQKVMFVNLPLLRETDYCRVLRSDMQLPAASDVAKGLTEYQPLLRSLVLHAPRCSDGVVPASVRHAIITLRRNADGLHLEPSFDDIIVTKDEMTIGTNEIGGVKTFRNGLALIHSVWSITYLNAGPLAKTFGHFVIVDTAVANLGLSFLSLISPLSMLVYQSAVLKELCDGSLHQNVTLSDWLHIRDGRELRLENESSVNDLIVTSPRICISDLAATHMREFKLGCLRGSLRIEATSPIQLRSSYVRMLLHNETYRIEAPSLRKLVISNSRDFDHHIVVHSLLHLTALLLDVNVVSAFVVGSQLRGVVSGSVTHFPFGWKEELIVNASWDGESVFRKYYFGEEAFPSLLAYDVPSLQNTEFVKARHLTVINVSSFKFFAVSQNTLQSLVLISLPALFMDQKLPLVLRTNKRLQEPSATDEALRQFHIEGVPLTSISSSAASSVFIKNVAGLTDLALMYELFETIYVNEDCNAVPSQLYPASLVILCVNMTELKLVEPGKGYFSHAILPFPKVKNVTIVGTVIAKLSFSAPQLRHLSLFNMYRLQYLKVVELLQIEQTFISASSFPSAVTANDSLTSAALISSPSLLVLFITTYATTFVILGSPSLTDLTYSSLNRPATELIMMSAIPRLTRLHLFGIFITEIVVLGTDPCRSLTSSIISKWRSKRNESHFMFVSGVPSLETLTIERVETSLIILDVLPKLKTVDMIKMPFVRNISASSAWGSIDARSSSNVCNLLQAPEATLFSSVVKVQPSLQYSFDSFRPSTSQVLLLISNSFSLSHLNLSFWSNLTSVIFDSWENVLTERRQKLKDDNRNERRMPAGIIDIPTLQNITLQNNIKLRAIRVHDVNGVSLRSVAVDGCAEIV